MTKELKNFIAGEWRASGHTFEKRSPFDGTLVAMVHEANEDMVNDAVIAGHDISIGGQSKLWGALPIKERLAIIHDFADKLLARVDDLVEADVADTGRSYWQARTFDLSLIHI